MAEQNREEIIADFKKWLEEHKEQFQEHISDGLSTEDLDDDFDDIWDEQKENGERSFQ